MSRNNALLECQPVTVSGAAQAYGICDVGHQGLFFDKEFGLYYNRARMLHPTLARFVQRDPMEYETGANLGEYTGSSPVSSVDPTGLFKQYHDCCPCEIGAIGKHVAKATQQIDDLVRKVDGALAFFNQRGDWAGQHTIYEAGA